LSAFPRLADASGVGADVAALGLVGCARAGHAACNIGNRGIEIATTLARRSAMTPKVVNPSMREKMERARRYFIERAGERSKDADAELYEELGNLAEAVEEMASLLDHQKIQLEEVRQGIGHHLEEIGSVPHTRRAR
jgi:hypothetical protein